MRRRLALAVCLVATIGYGDAPARGHRILYGVWRIRGARASGFEAEYSFDSNGTLYSRAEPESGVQIVPASRDVTPINWKTGTYKLANDRLSIRFLWHKDVRGKADKLHEKC